MGMGMQAIWPALAAATPGKAGGVDILTELAVIMGVAALTTVLFQKIKQPVVLGYLLAGLIVGSHLPVPLFANEQLTHELSEIGVVLLMFTLGLEFSLRKLVKVAPTAGVVAVIQCSLMIVAGYATGRFFGWTSLESFFAGALIAISSTTIIVKAFGEQGVKGKLADFVFGILIVEDLIAILLLAVLTPVASGADLSAGELAWTVARLGAFLVGMLVVGMLVIPRAVRLVVRIGRTETTLVGAVGICLAFALLARGFGYSVALGAFLGGALVAESGHGKTVEHAMEGVRDLFAAVFFVSVGMLIDPKLVLANWPAVVVLTLVVIVGKVFGVTLGAFLAGRSVRTSVQAGMSLAQIGEFSFIIAGVGLSLGAVGDFLYPVAVAVSALTTLVTPWLIRISGGVASFVDARLPPPLQTFASLYGSWVQRLRATPERKTAWATIRKLAALLLVDLVAVVAIVITASVGANNAVRLATPHLPLDAGLIRWLVYAGAALLSTPFLLGAVRLARGLGAALVEEALPRQTQALDPAASRRALLVTLQLGILLLMGIPLAALTQPFVRSFPVVLVVVVGVLLLVLPFWRSATDLHGHVRAGAQTVLASLASQAQSPGAEVGHATIHEDVKRLLPGMGETTTVRIGASDRSQGRTLKEINLRGLTGATVIAIDRGPQDIVFPRADEVLMAGDVLVLTGTEEAVALARDVLAGGDPSG
jgi:monovalent cation:H+ antiporter-2, CPA2 family